MKGKSHAIAGAATGVAVMSYFQVNAVVAISTSILGAMIVDIDEEHSTINKWLFPVSMKYRLIFKLLIGAILIALPFDFSKYIGGIFILSILSCKVRYRLSIFEGIKEQKFHRTIFHDPIIGGLLFVIPMYMLKLSESWTLPYIYGLASHYILDMFTDYGLPLYLSKGRRLRFPMTYRSGNNSAEYIILCTYILVVLGLSTKSFGEILVSIIAYKWRD